jgi:hypothetical protein
LEQIKRLEIWRGMIPVYSLNIDLPLTHTLHWLKLHRSTFYWMLGRTFKALREFQNDWSPFAPTNLSRHEGLQVDLPSCTTLQLDDCPMAYLRFLSCSNVQNFRQRQFFAWTISDLTALNSLKEFVFTLSRLQTLHIFVPHTVGIDSLIQFVFCDAREQRVWRDIKSAEVRIEFNISSDESHLFASAVGLQRSYEKWWKTFSVTEKRPITVIDNAPVVTINASM